MVSVNVDTFLLNSFKNPNCIASFSHQKKAAAAGTDEGPLTAACTLTEEMEMEQNRTHSIIEGNEVGTSSNYYSFLTDCRIIQNPGR